MNDGSEGFRQQVALGPAWRDAIELSSLLTPWFDLDVNVVGYRLGLVRLERLGSSPPVHGWSRSPRE